MKIPTKFRLPETTILLLVFLALFIVLTWIVPAGTFDRMEVDGRNVVVPGTYQRTEQNPQGLSMYLSSPYKGFIAAGEIIAFVFMVGGAFSVFTATGAVDKGIKSLVRVAERRPARKKLILPVIIIFFSLAGSTFGMAEEVLVFVLLTIPMCEALGYDKITGVAVSFVGAGVGFAGAFLNPFTIGIAQGISELQPFSGIEYRMVIWTVMTLISIVYIMRYANRIESTETRPIPSDLEDAFQLKHRLVLALLAFSLIVLVVGVVRFDWYIEEITALFLVMGFLSAVIGRMSSADALAAFYQGARGMMVPVMIIALSKGLILIAEEGLIIDTILNGMASSLEGAPAAVSAELMLVFQTGLNFFVPSGSGQAALTMPIMSPLSDLLGVGRQTAVLAYQFGDGLSNMIIPTSGITMGVLAIAKIPFGTWMKWMGPLFLWLSLAAAIFLWIPAMGWVWA